MSKEAIRLIKEINAMESFPALQASRLIQNADDATDLCDSLASTGAIKSESLRVLRENLTKWDAADPQELRNVTKKVFAELCQTMAGFAVGKGEWSLGFIQSFLMFRVLKYAVEAQCKRLTAQMQ